MTDRIALETLVELKDQFSNVYPRSPTGARGWVRARRELPKQDPEIFIEWDKAHWRYHGETDGWTYEHHFRPVADDGLDADPLMHEILEVAHRKVQAATACPDCGHGHDDSDTSERFMQTLLAAQEAAIDSDAFLIITVSSEEDGDHVIYQPQTFGDALSDAADETIGLRVLDLAGQLIRAFIDRRRDELESE